MANACALTAPRSGLDRVVGDPSEEFRRAASLRAQAHRIPIAHVNGRDRRAAQRASLLSERRQNRVEVDLGTADDVEDRRRRGLPPPRLGEFALRFLERRRQRLTRWFVSPCGAGTCLLVQGARLWPNAYCRDLIDPTPDCRLSLWSLQGIAGFNSRV